MKKLSIGYVFRKSITSVLSEISKKKAPEDIVYGLTRVQKKFEIVTPNTHLNSRILRNIQFLLNKFILLFVDTIGFSVVPTLFIIHQLNKVDLIFATADTYGLPIALLKKIGIIKKPLVYNTVGLYDGLTRKKNTLVLFFYKIILRTVDHFLSGGSQQECEKLSQLLNLPIKKFTFIPFGIDTKFFHPDETSDKGEILTIGIDPSRDWELFIEVAKNLPKEKFRLITYQNLVSSKLPDNIISEYNVSFELLRKRIWQAKIIILLTKQNHYFSGQSTMFRCMACAKPVIITSSPSIASFNLINDYNCKIVPRGDQKAVIKTINSLSSYTKRQNIGKRAREMIVSDTSIAQYGAKLSALFAKVLDEAYI